MSGSDSALVEIGKPVYGGSFLARIEGKAVFVPMALPGEEARVRITDSRTGYSTAEIASISRPSPERIAPACPHFAHCGGCNYQHAPYAQQLAFKRDILRETLERAGVAVPAEIQILAAPPKHSWAYRNRVRLAVDAAGNVGYRARRSHNLVSISQCPIAAPMLIETALAAAALAHRVKPVLRVTEMALFTNPDESAILATFLVDAPPRFPFQEFAEALNQRVPAVVGAELAVEGKPTRSMPDPAARTIAQWGETSLLYPAAGFNYRVDRGAFFQVNRRLIDPLVKAVTAQHSGALAWDLFAGVGLFARRLTTTFRRVVAVESAPASTKALAANLKGTRSTPVRATTLEFLRNNSAASPPDLVVVDPPRAGLGTETTDLLASIGPAAMAYVSCDPATLARDLRALSASGFQVDSVAMADLFPHTYHIETVVQIRRA